ncbi:MAG: MBL fold metallo-hydrolase [Candidatus Accumulibacter necessarius]|jgi:glyoxylase-like metal-dependent hydrolase (beta-lactamase superfamily II)|uniref:MBL fold metallo-hydrolase n=1 Tax=Candidatus Accumulibacter necessarius TaxID=2954386 RepID=UPI002FC29F5E
MGPQIRIITSEICQVGGPGQTDQSDAAIYLVHFADSAALIDAGSGRASDRVLMNIEAAGVLPEQVQYLLLTHCHYDHTGGAAAFRQRFGWRVAIHSLEATALETGDNKLSAASWYGDHLAPCPVDLRLADGDRILLAEREIQVIHIPGHSPGSLAYLVESEGKRVLFAQDVHGPIHPALLSNRADYQASLRKLQALQADILCEGHYGVFVGQANVAAFIDGFVED